MVAAPAPCSRGVRGATSKGHRFSRADRARFWWRSDAGDWFEVGGRVGVVLGQLAEAGADWVVVDVGAVGEEVVVVAHAAVGEASLPDGEL